MMERLEWCCFGEHQSRVGNPSEGEGEREGGGRQVTVAKKMGEWMRGRAARRNNES